MVIENNGMKIKWQQGHMGENKNIKYCKFSVEIVHRLFYRDGCIQTSPRISCR
jgi:hypothetical protein